MSPLSEEEKGKEGEFSFPDWDCLDYVESAQNYQGNYHNYVYRTIKSLSPLKNQNFSRFIEKNSIILPGPEPIGKTLILDLDETLIHADFDRIYKDYDAIINFVYNGEETQVPIFIRPGLFEFLQLASQNFEIFIFTASIKEYADAVLNFLDPQKKVFKFRFYRNDCINVKNRIFIKDLRIFTNRKQENIIIVDNSLYSFTNQISNGVLINSFYNDQEDRELLNLMSYLNILQDSQDVRVLNESVFNFNLISESIHSLVLT
jgi:CTD small phosphatase-like protein 2